MSEHWGYDSELCVGWFNSTERIKCALESIFGVTGDQQMIWKELSNDDFRSIGQIGSGKLLSDIEQVNVPNQKFFQATGPTLS